jgi:hypothetical protein
MFPVVRITIAGMQQEMQVALGRYITGLDSDLQHALEAAVRAFDVERLISEEATRVVRSEVEQQMQVAIQRAVKDAFAGDEIRTELEASVAGAIRTIFSKSWLA